MERKVPFEEREVYHLFTRGVEKRKILVSDEDAERLLFLLHVCNREKGVRIADILKASRGEPLRKRFGSLPEAPTLVDILGYALMPNHFHLIVREKTTGGISKFMLKLMTAYSMYFNTKYERSGPLFTRPFRSKHIDTDEYLRWAFAYVHLNPLELFQADWKECGLQATGRAAAFLGAYRYSSFPDYFSGTRPESIIVSQDEGLFATADVRTIDGLLRQLSEAQRPVFDTSPRFIRERNESLV